MGRRSGQVEVTLDSRGTMPQGMPMCSGRLLFACAKVLRSPPEVATRIQSGLVLLCHSRGVGGSLALNSRTDSCQEKLFLAFSQFLSFGVRFLLAFITTIQLLYTTNKSSARIPEPRYFEDPYNQRHFVGPGYEPSVTGVACSGTKQPAFLGGGGTGRQSFSGPPA